MRRPTACVCAFAPTLFEELEPRRLLSISLGADGWTVFPTTGKRILYVSSSGGSDSNSGTSSGAPFKTFDKAKSIINAGGADWVLLKRGDTFPSLGNWTKSGPSATDPLLIGSYGTAVGTETRAIVDSNTSDGFDTLGTGGAVNNFALVGIHFKASGYNGVNASPTGIRLLKQGSGILIEDCYVEGFKDNVVFQGDGAAINGLTMRRNVIVDSYTASGSVGHSQGIYVSGSSRNISFIENVIDHNGWKEGVAAPVGFNHDVYVNTGALGMVFTGNIISRASYNGILLRAGGTVTNNLMVRNPVGVIVGNTNSAVQNNVILEGMDLPNLAQGLGVNSVGVPSLVVENNIIAHDISNYSSGVAGITMQAGVGSGRVGDNIIYDWRLGINSYGAGVSIDHNQVQEQDDDHFLINQRQSGGYTHSNNTWSSSMAGPFRLVNTTMDITQWKAQVEPSAIWKTLKYLDPYRTVGGYAATKGLGDGSFEAWIAAARAQSHLNWNPALLAQPAEDYIRQGFTVLGDSDPDPNTGRIIVNVFAPDPFAKEPATQGVAGDPGTFTFTRTGPTDHDLVVKFTLGGDADNFVDYQLSTSKLSITFPVGVSTLNVTLNPLWDGIIEGNENAIIQLSNPPAPDPTKPWLSYELGYRQRATVVIDDADDTTLPGDDGTGDPGDGGGGTGGGIVGQQPISGDGLFGQYFDDEFFNSLNFTRNDYKIDLDFGTNSPGGTVAPTTWAARWTGFIEPEFGETPQLYTFYLPADDASRLYIDDGTGFKLVIDNWGHFPGDANDNGKVEITDYNALAANFNKHLVDWPQGDFDGNTEVDVLDFNILAANFGKTAPARKTSGTIALKGDTKYAIKVEMRNTSGPASVHLSWSSQEQLLEVVPHDRLYTGQNATAPSGAAAASTSTSSATTSSVRTQSIGGSSFSSTTIPSDDKHAVDLVGVVDETV